ncbi:hypothetical protein MACK_003481 [Theileria orientalis]|uniref:Signal peptide containing protein n=1 Tax=Theileria orientalis TaxID=68886 RepID=A0A976SJD5_THEOR|nr:hypothetical protein MACK_003481 [Theileria orientalis]
MNDKMLVLIKCAILLNFCLCIFPRHKTVLNISDETKDLLLLRLKHGDGPLKFITYVPNITKTITKVMDGASIIWDTDQPEELLCMLKLTQLYGRSRLCYAYILRSTAPRTLYFKRQGNEWVQISEITYDKKMREVRKQRMFDLTGNMNDGTYFIQTHDLYGLISTVFIPYHMYDIVTVCDDFDILWEKKNDSDKCTCIIVHGDLPNTQLIHLHLKIDNTHKQMFMRKYEDDWKPIDKEQFYQYLNQLDDQMFVEQIHNNDL